MSEKRSRRSIASSLSSPFLGDHKKWRRERTMTKLSSLSLWPLTRSLPSSGWFCGIAYVKWRSNYTSSLFYSRSGKSRQNVQRKQRRTSERARSPRPPFFILLYHLPSALSLADTKHSVAERRKFQIWPGPRSESVSLGRRSLCPSLQIVSGFEAPLWPRRLR